MRVLTFNYPVGDYKRGTEIVKKDLKCLGYYRLINDKIMDLCLKHYFLEEVNPTLREKTELFSSLFYSSVSGEAFKQRNQPSGWTKNLKNPFDNDFLVVPIADSGHWILAIICYAKLANKNVNNDSQSNTVGNGILPSSANSIRAAPKYRIPLKRKLPGSGGPIIPDTDTDNQSTQPLIQLEPKILLLDSLHSYKDISRKKIAETLRLFLTLEWKKRYPEIPFTFTKENIPLHVPKVPQQDDTFDCGVYAIHFFECFFKKSTINPFKKPFKLGNEWYDDKNIKTGAKRDQLYQRIKDLMKKHSSPLLEGLPPTTASFSNRKQIETSIDMLGRSNEATSSSSEEEELFSVYIPESNCTLTNGHRDDNNTPAKPTKRKSNKKQSSQNSRESSPQQMQKNYHALKMEILQDWNSPFNSQNNDSEISDENDNEYELLIPRKK